MLMNLFIQIQHRKLPRDTKKVLHGHTFFVTETITQQLA